MDSVKNTFSINISVTANDLDAMNHVNNVVYVKWIQEVAAAHWEALASDEMKHDILWVVLRHEIDYIAPAFKDDLLIATTWVEESIGPRSERFVSIANATSGKTIAKAKTVWCMIDSKSLRPKRVDERVIAVLKQH